MFSRLALIVFLIVGIYFKSLLFTTMNTTLLIPRELLNRLCHNNFAVGRTEGIHDRFRGSIQNEGQETE